MVRQQEGLSISRAVKLWRNLEESGQNPLNDLMQTPITSQSNKNHSTIVPTSVNTLSGSTVEELSLIHI